MITKYTNTFIHIQNDPFNSRQYCILKILFHYKSFLYNGKEHIFKIILLQIYIFIFLYDMIKETIKFTNTYGTLTIFSVNKTKISYLIDI